MSSALPHADLATARLHPPSARLALICAAIVILPFNSGSTTAMGLAVSESLLMLLAVASFTGMVVRGEQRLVFSRADVVGALFLIAVACSALFSVYPIDAWRGAGAMLLMAVGYRVAVGSAENDSRYDHFLMYALMASGVLQALIGVHQYFFKGWYQANLPEFYATNLLPNQRGGIQRVVGGFINPNYYAGLLNLCLAVSLSYLLFGKGTRLQRAFAALASALFVAAIVLSGSKGGLIATALIIAVLFIKREKRLIWVVLVAIAALAIVPNPVRDSFVRGVVSDPYVAMRPGIWMESLHMAADHPLLGVGPSNFHFIAHQYIPPTDFLLVRYSHVPNIAHNAYLEALAEFGIVGFLPLAILFVMLLWLAGRTVASRDPEDSDWVLRLGIAVGIFGVFTHSLVDNLAANRAVIVILLFCIAPLARQVSKSSGPGLLQQFTRRDRLIDAGIMTTPIGVVGVFLAAAWFFLVQVAAPLYYEQKMKSIGAELQAAFAGAPATSGAALLDVRQRLDGLAQYYPDNLALCRAIGRVEMELFRGSGDIRNYSSAIRWFSRAERSLHGVSTSDAFSILSVDFLLIERGYPKTAELLDAMRSAAERAISAWPNRAIYYHMAAMIEREADRLPQAMDHLKRAIALEPNFQQAYLDLARIATVKGDTGTADEARDNLRAAQERIRRGPRPEQDDPYAWEIVAPPR